MINKNIVGDLDLMYSKVTVLPKGLKVGGNLYLEGSKVTVLPEGLEVGGNLDLRGSKVTTLPKGFKVGGDLYLGGSKVAVLPEGFKVGGSLYLWGSKVTTLPEGFKVGCMVLLDETNMHLISQISGRYEICDLCCHSFTVAKNKLKIGCKTKTLLQWARWFEGDEEFDTSRGTEEFEQIERAFNTVKNLLEVNR